MANETFRYKLSRWKLKSRDPGFLARAALLVLAVFGMAGVVVHAFVEVPDTPGIDFTSDFLPSQGPNPTPTPSPSPDSGDGDSESDSPLPGDPHDGFSHSMLEAQLALEVAKQSRDWAGVAYWVTRIDLLGLASPVLILSLVAGGVWAIIAAQFAGFKPDQLALYVGAILLGFVSATLTLIAVVMQEMRGFVEGGDFTQQMIYWIGGVGLREESLKLLCFAPLLFFLRKRAEIDALICGAMVGLGFAIQENVNYYNAQGVTDAFGRMMTANFLHMAMTAFTGRALFRMMKAPKQRWEEFLGTFIVIVLLHGFYDAFISVPELAGYSLFSLIILAVLSFRFSAVVGEIGRIGPSLGIAPVAVFVIGMAVLTGSVYLFCCTMLPPIGAAVICGISLIGLFPIAAMFIYQMHRH